MLGEHIASQSEVIRAIVTGYSRGYGPPHPRQLQQRLGLIELALRPYISPELKISTPAHTKQLGLYVEFEFRVTHRHGPNRPSQPRASAPRVPPTHHTLLSRRRPRVSRDAAFRCEANRSNRTCRSFPACSSCRWALSAAAFLASASSSRAVTAASWLKAVARPSSAASSCPRCIRADVAT